MRKLLLSLAMFFGMAGIVSAVQVTVVKYDKEKKVLTYKEKDSDKEETATVDDKTKFTTTDQKGENSKEATYADFEKRVSGKGGKGGVRVEITVKDGKITEGSWKLRGKN